ncbi:MULTISPECIES: hypothetical protein [Streptomyces]|uniref:hypothetical protein n=1 Tax=Streptomyces TaxID=1883 RepID=UPI00292EC902|nr:hypothetical protein [Streptomyces sp. NEAU-HV9]
MLVAAALWPAHRDTLTIRTTPDLHAQARELLRGHEIDVPDSLSRADLAAQVSGIRPTPGRAAASALAG